MSNVNQNELGKVIRSMQHTPASPAGVNQAELGKVIRDMQDASLNKAKQSSLFNQNAANVINQGVHDKANAAPQVPKIKLF